jgi:NitT/TauT family transport system substrate-binding protein
MDRGWQRSGGAIDALAYYDTGFGQIEAAGISFKLIPRPPKLPLIGGQFVEARNELLGKDRALAVGMGRSVCKASQFIQARPEAGARAFLRMFPETAPRGSSTEVAVAAVLQAIGRRIKLYTPPYAGAKMGSINVQEFKTEAEMNNLKIDDFSPFYTNDLIDDINHFDVDAIKAQAKAYT